MAKGNLILGTMSGKLGDVVAYTNNGKQCARVRRRVVANPNSAGQQVQRMILTTVAQFTSAFRPILNNGFEGKQKGAPSLAYARKLAMRMLRTEGMWNTDNGMRYVMKGGKYFAPNNYILSTGTLTAPQATLAADCLGNVIATQLSAQMKASDLFPFAAVGMQHTIIFGACVADGTTPRTKFIAVSFVFKDDTTPVLVANGDDFKLNPAALETGYTQGDIDSLIFTTEGIESATQVVCGAYILSSKDGSKRSNAHLVVDTVQLDNLNLSWSPDQVVETYDNSGVDSGAPAEYYLDNNAGGN